MPADTSAWRPRRRRRGQAVLKSLNSTDDFTNQSKLGLADRVLILFLVVVLVDEDGCLATMFRRLVEAHATDPGHWAYGRTPERLQNMLGKTLGKCALRRPSWERIADALRVQIPPERLAPIMAVAAGLYRQAAGPDALGAVPSWPDEVRLPSWAGRPKVTVDMIRTGSDLGIDTEAPTPRVTFLRDEPEDDPLARENEELRTEVDDLKLSRRQLQQTMIEYCHNDKEDHRELRDAHHKLWERYFARLRQLYPDKPAEELRGIMDAEAAADRERGAARVEWLHRRDRGAEDLRTYDEVVDRSS
ncbi:hypothetical protein [Amycolatopsis samaneae]|uniref:Uncharacterized protein n=1 Tax=Amycolatopsis samaneae TaxID=664691 RepID=A0ABW5GS15_9PSEU